MKKALVFLIISILAFSFSSSVFAEDTFTGEYTNYEVSSANFNGTIFYAWTGTGTSKVNIASLKGSKVTLNEESIGGPTLLSFKNKLFLAWAGNDGRLNIMSSSDGINFSNKVTLRDASLRSVSLTAFEDKIVMCWAGRNNNKINVIQSTNGVTWKNKVTLNESSRYTPIIETYSLYSMDEGRFISKLNISWVSNTYNNIDTIISNDGITWSNKVTTSGFKTNCSARGDRGSYSYVDSNDNTYYNKYNGKKHSTNIITNKLPSFSQNIVDTRYYHNYTFYKGLDSKIYYKYEFNDIGIMQ